MGDDDGEVIRASLDVPERFGEIFERHYRTLDSYCVRRLGGAGHDVSAATFVAAFHGRAGFDPVRGDVRGWLYGIASNLLRRHRRSEARRLHAYARSEPAMPVTFDADTRIDAVAAGTRLAQGLRGLPGRDRDALLLFAWADLSYEQIAVALGIPIGTVRSRIARARSRLRNALGDLAEIHDPDLSNVRRRGDVE